MSGQDAHFEYINAYDTVSMSKQTSLSGPTRTSGLRGAPAETAPRLWLVVTGSYHASCPLGVRPDA